MRVVESECLNLPLTTTIHIRKYIQSWRKKLEYRREILSPKISSPFSVHLGTPLLNVYLHPLDSHLFLSTHYFGDQTTDSNQFEGVLKTASLGWWANIWIRRRNEGFVLDLFGQHRWSRRTEAPEMIRSCHFLNRIDFLAGKVGRTKRSAIGL